MKERLKLFLRYGLFWLSFFVIARLFFLAYHHEKCAQLSFTDVLLLNLHGLRLDMSMMGYFMLIPGLMIVFTTYFKSIILDWLLKIYTALILFVASFVVVADLELYHHWGFRLDATPLMYLGKEAAGSGDLSTTITLVVFWLIFYVSFWHTIKSLFPYLQSLSPLQNGKPW